MENPRYQAAPRSGSFLGAVANACIAHFDDLTDLCFVFPNKRSATVFQLALAESLDGRAILAPEITITLGCPFFTAPFLVVIRITPLPA